jgi:hypothetical protein
LKKDIPRVRIQKSGPIPDSHDKKYLHPQVAELLAFLDDGGLSAADIALGVLVWYAGCHGCEGPK